ncbi:MAG: hypothetical protein KDG89_16245 [Geminicoccaceae bacterium]|nr:hypothetical protein [Geminicoccaceae bacterium]
MRRLLALLALGALLLPAACGRKGEPVLPNGEKAPPVDERPAPEVG